MSEVHGSGFQTPVNYNHDQPGGVQTPGQHHEEIEGQEHEVTEAATHAATQALNNGEAQHAGTPSGVQANTTLHAPDVGQQQTAEKSGSFLSKLTGGIKKAMQDIKTGATSFVSTTASAVKGDQKSAISDNKVENAAIKAGNAAGGALRYVGKRLKEAGHEIKFSAGFGLDAKIKASYTGHLDKAKNDVSSFKAELKSLDQQLAKAEQKHATILATGKGNIGEAHGEVTQLKAKMQEMEGHLEKAEANVKKYQPLVDKQPLSIQEKVSNAVSKQFEGIKEGAQKELQAMKDAGPTEYLKAKGEALMGRVTKFATETKKDLKLSEKFENIKNSDLMGRVSTALGDTKDAAGRVAEGAMKAFSAMGRGIRDMVVGKKGEGEEGAQISKGLVGHVSDLGSAMKAALPSGETLGKVAKDIGTAVLKPFKALAAMFNKESKPEKAPDYSTALTVMKQTNEQTGSACAKGIPIWNEHKGDLAKLAALSDLSASATISLGAGGAVQNSVSTKEFLFGEGSNFIGNQLQAAVNYGSRINTEPEAVINELKQKIGQENPDEMQLMKAFGAPLKAAAPMGLEACKAIDKMLTQAMNKKVVPLANYDAEGAEGLRPEYNAWNKRVDEKLTGLGFGDVVQARLDLSKRVADASRKQNISPEDTKQLLADVAKFTARLEEIANDPEAQKAMAQVREEMGTPLPRFFVNNHPNYPGLIFDQDQVQGDLPKLREEAAKAGINLEEDGKKENNFKGLKAFAKERGLILADGGFAVWKPPSKEAIAQAKVWKEKLGEIETPKTQPQEVKDKAEATAEAVQNFPLPSASTLTGATPVDSQTILNPGHPLPPPQVHTDTVLFPTMLSDVKLINASIGGSTGAKLMEAGGEKFVQKEGPVAQQGAAGAAKHITAEYHANLAYKALGVNVPEVKLYTQTSSGAINGQATSASTPVMLASFVKDAKPLGKYLAECSPKQREELLAKVQKDFIADVMLANWDVVGMGMDNILVTSDGTPVRIDNGSCFEFRAQGDEKAIPKLGIVGFSNQAIEVDSFRNPQINPQAAQIFGSISDKEIIRQIDDLAGKFDQLLAATPPKYHAALQGRMEYLQNYKQQLQQKQS